MCTELLSYSYPVFLFKTSETFVVCYDVITWWLLCMIEVVFTEVFGCLFTGFIKHRYYWCDEVKQESLGNKFRPESVKEIDK